VGDRVAGARLFVVWFMLFLVVVLLFGGSLMETRHSQAQIRRWWHRHIEAVLTATLGAGLYRGRSDDLT